MDVRVGLWRKLSTEELMLLNCGVGEDSWESLGLQGDPTSPSWRKSVLTINWKDWCWSWNSNTLTTWCEQPTHLKRPSCWERLKAGGKGDNRGWDGWMAWVWVNSKSWWWTERPGVLQSMGSHRVGHHWVTELNWPGPRITEEFPFSLRIAWLLAAKALLRISHKKLHNYTTHQEWYKFY